MATTKHPGPRRTASRSNREGRRRTSIDAIVDLLKERAEFMDTVRHDLDIQFKRIAEIQADVDRLKRALARRGGS
jgi:hypothetical protein